MILTFNKSLRSATSNNVNFPMSSTIFWILVEYCFSFPSTCGSGNGSVLYRRLELTASLWVCSTVLSWSLNYTNKSNFRPTDMRKNSVIMFIVFHPIKWVIEVIINNRLSSHNTHKPLCNTIHHNMVLDLTWFKDGSQQCTAYIDIDHKC